MKYEHTFRAFGEVDEALVEDAAPTRKAAPRTMLKRWGALAACLLLSASVGFGAWRMRETAPNPDTSEEESTDTVTTTTTTASTKLQSENATEGTHQNAGAVTTEPALETGDGNASTPTTRFPTSIVGGRTTVELGYLVPRWEEMTITRQFSEATYQDNRYSIHNAALPADKVGRRLGTDTASGFDIYTDTTHTIGVTLFAIDGIAEECAVAVQYEGIEGYYPAVHSWYRPKTLGQFITDLDLKNQTSFGAVYYSYFDETNRYRRFRFEDIDDGVVWAMLLSDTTLENVYDDREMYVSHMGISVDIPLLGYENISLSVTEEGYLTTNILDTGKAFYIGKDKVNAFVDYVLNHCEGVELVYEADLTTSVDENAGEKTELTVVSSARPPQTTQYHAK